MRRFYDNISKDSLPFIPMQVEVQIITINPVIPQQEIDEVKSRLRDYAQQVNSGEREFSTLAILYSQDQATAVYGGETGFQSRSVLLPEYATAAFNLSDSKRVSNIVETDDGYHIIQLIEKRGDRINTRHILLRPKVSDKDLTDALARLDSVRTTSLTGNEPLTRWRCSSPRTRTHAITMAICSTSRITARALRWPTCLSRWAARSVPCSPATSASRLSWSTPRRVESR